MRVPKETNTYLEKLIDIVHENFGNKYRICDLRNVEKRCIITRSYSNFTVEFLFFLMYISRC